MSNRAAITQYSYRGPFGEVSQSGRNFFAWQNGHLIGNLSDVRKGYGAPRLERKIKDEGSPLEAQEPSAHRVDGLTDRVIERHI
jgi:hypothetical protein